MNVAYFRLCLVQNGGWESQRREKGFNQGYTHLLVYQILRTETSQDPHKQTNKQENNRIHLDVMNLKLIPVK